MYASGFPPTYSESLEPPNYTPEVSVVRRPNYNERDVFWLEIDGPEDRILQPGSIVSGRAVVNPTMAFHFTGMDVELQMIESTAKPTAYGEHRATRNISLVQNKIPGPFLPQDQCFKNGNMYSYSFSLEVPVALPVSSCAANLSTHYKLPPTLGGSLEKPQRDESGANYPTQINYRVIARIIGEDKPLLIVHKNLKLFPYYSGELATRGKYESSEGELKKGLLRRASIGGCQLSVVDPAVVQLLARTPFLYDLSVVYTPSSNEISAAPKCIQRISYKLQAHTITSPQAVGEIPEPNDPGYKTLTENITNQKIDGPKLDWKLSGTFLEGATNVKSFETKIQLPLVLPCFHKNLVPGFSTCMTTRKYSLYITVYFGSSVSTSLNVPLSVIASPNETSTSTVSTGSSYYARRSTFGPTPPYYESLYPFASTGSQDIQQNQGTHIR